MRMPSGGIEKIFRALDGEFNFTLAAGACGGRNGLAGSRMPRSPRMKTQPVDLDSQWRGETVLCVPWAGKRRISDEEIVDWLDKAEAESGGGTKTVLMLPARVGDDWFVRRVWRKHEVRFLEDGAIQDEELDERFSLASRESMMLVVVRPETEEEKKGARHEEEKDAAGERESGVEARGQACITASDAVAQDAAERRRLLAEGGE